MERWARRLVEWGVPFVTVNNTGWDNHTDLMLYRERHPGSPDTHAHIPALDQALSALVGDLSDRGMLDETLVVVMGEFGRIPKINTNGGRDGTDAPICQDSRSRSQVCGLARSVVCHHALKDLAGEKAFETADDLPFGPPFSGASFDVVEGW